MELLTAAQMRAIETGAIDSGAVTGLELMERAGQGVLEAIFAEWPELAGTGGEALPPQTPPGYLGTENGTRRAVVLCGPGNNGGDGFVVARLLKERGWAVEAFLYGDPEKLPPDARVNYERWRGMGEVRGISALERRTDAHRCPGADLVIDALFGTGLARSLDAGAADAICLALRGYPGTRLVSVDVPSGLCADSGRPLVQEGYGESGKTARSWPALEGPAVEADLTVTFHRPKRGHFLADGPRHCGRLVVKDIGLGQQVEAGTVLQARGWPPALSKRQPGHKYTYGHALILSGPATRTGAARLAARGALRVGAGAVTVGAPAEALAEHAARLDAVMLREIGTAEGLRVALADGRINALCLGPGLGLDDRARGLVAAALGVVGDPPAPELIRGLSPRGASAGDRGPGSDPGRVGNGDRRPTVLDADALTLLSRDPALFAALHPGCVLTPHHGEFGRIFPDIAERLAVPATKGPAYSKVDATREAAARAGCVVLYKGPDTVIADSSGRCSINSAAYDRAAPWLATAGSGDVLAGFIAGLLARGFAPMEAAETAAWLHVDCARSFGPGLIAEDIPGELPKVFRSLGL